MARCLLAKGRLVTLPLDPTLRAAEIGHWEAEGYRVLEPRAGSRFIALVEPLTTEVADLALTRLPEPRSIGRMALRRLEERLGPEPALAPYDWEADGG